jgi:metal-dependent hydrolases of the beta-lactamase superfamily I
MELRVIATGSRGNAYALISKDGNILLLECGVPLLKVKEAIDWQIGKVVGVLLTHIHGDHAGYIREFLRARLRVYTSQGTADELDRLGVTPTERQMVRVCSNGREIIGDLKGFRVIPFSVEHDAPDPLGFLIHHEESGKVLFATDTYFIRNRFKGVGHMLIECNYQSSIVADNFFSGRLNSAMWRRLETSHMSYDNCLKFVKANQDKDLRNIVLLHWSEGNSNPDSMRQGIEEATAIPTSVARAGLRIKLNKTPF